MSNGVASATTSREAWDKKVRRRLNVARSMGMTWAIGGCVLSCPVGSKEAVAVMVDVMLENRSALVQLSAVGLLSYVRCDLVKSI